MRQPRGEDTEAQGNRHEPVRTVATTLMRMKTVIEMRIRWLRCICGNPGRVKHVIELGGPTVSAPVSWIAYLPQRHPQQEQA